MTWVATAVSVGSAAYGAYRQHDTGPGAPPPQQLPGPSSPGAINTSYGNLVRDPVTGAWTSYDYGFDPTQMRSQWDAESMYNDFMGGGNSGVTSDIDWKIKSLQDKYNQMKGSPQGAGAAGEIPAKFKDLQRFLDEKGNLPDMSDTNAIIQGRINTPQAKALVDQFQKDTGGKYGSNNRDVSFGKWLRDFNQKNLQPLVQEFQQTQQVQGGNKSSNDAALMDLQNQIDYLTQAKTRYGGSGAAGGPSGASGSGNPFDPFLKDLGAKWAGNGGNVNPRTGQWGALTDKNIEGAMNNDPMDEFEKYMGTQADPAARERAISEFREKMSGALGGSLGGKYETVSAPSLDPNAATSLERAANFKAAQDMSGQQAQLRNRLGARGMSAMGEIAAFGAGQNLIGQELQNQASAQEQANNLTAQNWGMRSQAANQNNSAFFQDRAQQLAARDQGLNAYGQLSGMQNNLFNQGMAQTGLAQQMKDQWFQRALQSLGASNQMRTEDRAWDVQDYGLRRGENDALYGRTNDQWNRLNQAKQQAFANRLGLSGQANQSAGMLLGPSMQMADWQNQGNLANTQQQNSYNMYQANQQAAGRNAQDQAIMNGLGAFAQGWGQYAAKPSTGTMGSSSPKVSATGWETGSPNWKWE